jgi:heme/copper-type cytochrome/quinol oxidase subunit 1
MGAIYALFAAMFYWIGKITGLQCNEKWGVIHFYLFTIAVNIVFFPMHNVTLAPLLLKPIADLLLFILWVLIP